MNQSDIAEGNVKGEYDAEKKETQKHRHISGQTLFFCLLSVSAFRLLLETKGHQERTHPRDRQMHGREKPWKSKAECAQDKFVV